MAESGADPQGAIATIYTLWGEGLISDEAKDNLLARVKIEASEPPELLWWQRKVMARLWRDERLRLVMPRRWARSDMFSKLMEKGPNGQEKEER